MHSNRSQTWLQTYMKEQTRFYPRHYLQIFTDIFLLLQPQRIRLNFCHICQYIDVSSSDVINNNARSLWMQNAKTHTWCDPSLFWVKLHCWLEIWSTIRKDGDVYRIHLKLWYDMQGNQSNPKVTVYSSIINSTLNVRCSFQSYNLFCSYSVWCRFGVQLCHYAWCHCFTTRGTDMVASLLCIYVQYGHL